MAKFIRKAAELADEGGEKVAKRAKLAKKVAQNTTTAKADRLALRGMSQADAIAKAKEEGHLRPKTGGGYEGAPHAAQNIDDVMRLRANFDKDVEGGVSGADWYGRTQDHIKTFAGPEPERQSELARNYALFSAQSDPNANQGFSIKARNAAIAGKPLDKVRTGSQARTYNQAFGYRPEGVAEEDLARWRSGKIEDPKEYSADLSPTQDIRLGKKTGIFGGHMDPTVDAPVTGTNDIWHARALGYTNPKTGKPWSAGLGVAQHDWMDHETLLAVDRANANGLGGRTDWTPAEIQAAPWVFKKAQGLAERWGWDMDKAMAEATKTYPDNTKNWSGFETYEETPGVGIGHLPDIAEGSKEERQALFDDPRSGWDDEHGRDILQKAKGTYFAPTEKSTGFFDWQGKTDINPARTVELLVSPESVKNRELDIGSKEAMRGPTALRSYVDAQIMGGNSALIPPKKASDINSYEFNLKNEPQGEGLLKAKREGLADLIHYGQREGPQRGVLTNFGDEGPYLPGKPGKRATSAVEQHLNEQFGEGNSSVRPMKLVSEPTFYGDKWLEPAYPGANRPGGSGEVTKELFKQLQDYEHEQLDTPEFRQKVRGKFERDQELAGQGHDIREDLQNARWLLANGGIKSLKQAVVKGVITAAAAIGATLPFTGAGIPSEREDK